MGSSLSGRRNGKPLVENCLTIDLAHLMRLGPIRDGLAGNGQLHWSIDGQRVASIRFRLDLRATETAQLILRYTPATPNGKQKPMRQVIALMSTQQHLGGRRWWMRCPVTGERIRTLHLPPDGKYFASRKAWRLAYHSERLSYFDRPFEKLFRAQRKLGDAAGLGAQVKRPKGMWHRTFACHRARIEHHDLACVGQIAAQFEQT